MAASIVIYVMQVKRLLRTVVYSAILVPLLAQDTQQRVAALEQQV
jgi:hypothetical protein